MPPASRLASSTGCVAQGVLEPVDDPAAAGGRAARSRVRARRDLTPEQEEAAALLRAAPSRRLFSVTLLDGVTGSGKTEVYFEAVAAALPARQAGADPAAGDRADPGASSTASHDRFGARPAEWHSDVAAAARERVWRQVADGRVPGRGRRALGAVPAVRELGLIVVDEEHDPAYKQEDGVFYNARDMAVVRGRIARLPGGAGLGDAVDREPRQRRAGPLSPRSCLPARYGAARAAGHRAPSTCARAPPERGRLLSPPLVAAIAETLGRGEQALLFLNRRGYAPLTLCRACGHRFQCPNCSAWLVEHRFRGQLVCHHCGHHEPTARGLPGMRRARQPGRLRAGRRALAEEVARRFPEARTLVLSSDLLGGVAAAAARARGDRQRRGRHRHRHPARRQGPQLSRT